MDSPSQRCSQILASCSQRDQILTLDEEEEIRNYYLSIIDDKKLSFQDKINKIKTELATEYGSLMNYSSARIKRISYYPGKNQGIDLIENKSIFSIGRFPENEIAFENNYVSRINCLIFLYQNKLVVLDSWSLHGTCCINIKTGQRFMSYPGHRQIMIFSGNDTVMVGTYGGDIIINPERCAECKTGPKQVCLSCGHLEICYLCYRRFLDDQNSDALCSKCILPIVNLLGKETKIFLPLDPSENFRIPERLSGLVVTTNFPLYDPDEDVSSSSDSFDSATPWQEMSSFEFSSSPSPEGLKINQFSKNDRSYSSVDSDFSENESSSGKRKRLPEKSKNGVLNQPPAKRIKPLTIRSLVSSCLLRKSFSAPSTIRRPRLRYRPAARANSNLPTYKLAN